MTYAGATARLMPAEGLRLPAAWGWQPKVDGCYAVATCDASGAICSVVSRAGRELREGRDLHGIIAGPPGSVLAGELEAHTEAGSAAAARQGYRRLHLFDALSVAGQDLRGLPYSERWGWLHRAQSMVESDGLARVASWRDDSRRGRAHAVDGSGRYVRRVPVDLRRLPIVPLVRGHEGAAALWRSHVEDGGGEGLVAVRLDARLGARASKRKIKLTDTIEARVLRVAGGVALLAWSGGTSADGWRARPAPFEVAAWSGLRRGQVVEVTHDGWYDSGVPRFARALRVRVDLAA